MTMKCSLICGLAYRGLTKYMYLYVAHCAICRIKGKKTNRNYKYKFIKTGFPLYDKGYRTHQSSPFTQLREDLILVVLSAFIGTLYTVRM